jgi:hypothetical protein
VEGSVPAAESLLDLVTPPPGTGGMKLLPPMKAAVVAVAVAVVAQEIVATVFDLKQCAAAKAVLSLCAVIVRLR